MVPRRQFLGSIAACFVASGSTASFAYAWPSTLDSLNDLKWGSVVIESLPQKCGVPFSGYYRCQPAKKRRSISDCR